MAATDTVSFEFDRFFIDFEERPALEDWARWLTGGFEVHVTIVGVTSVAVLAKKFDKYVPVDIPDKAVAVRVKASEALTSASWENQLNFFRILQDLYEGGLP